MTQSHNPSGAQIRSFKAFLPTSSLGARSRVPSISLETGQLAIRAGCAESGCGLADKHAVQNKYRDSRITFACPNHGEHTVDLMIAGDLDRLEFNTPFRNLIRMLLCGMATETSWVMCIGADYADFHPEQVLWRHLVSPR